MGEAERGVSAPRRTVAFYCANGHEVHPAFADDAEVPQFWDCPRCGQPAGRDRSSPPSTRRNEPYKTHLAYVMERRSEAEGAALLEEALSRVKRRRGD